MDFTEDLLLVHQVDIYFQQDRAPPHYTQAEREYLNDPDKLFGTSEPIHSPARYIFKLSYLFVIYFFIF